jgi:hypothetical protein
MFKAGKITKLLPEELAVQGLEVQGPQTLMTAPTPVKTPSFSNAPTGGTAAGGGMEQGAGGGAVQNMTELKSALNIGQKTDVVDWITTNWDNLEEISAKIQSVIETNPILDKIANYLSKTPLVDAIQADIKKNPALAKLELLEGVQPPEPQDYPDPVKGEAGHTVAELPNDVWKAYFTDYCVPKEAQQLILTGGAELQGMITPSEKIGEYGLGSLAGFIWWKEGNPGKGGTIELAGSFVEGFAAKHETWWGQVESQWMAHEIAHWYQDNVLSDEEYKEFQNLLPALKGTDMGDWVIAQGASEAYACVYQYTLLYPNLFPKEFDKFYSGLGIKELRKWTEASQ